MELESICDQMDQIGLTVWMFGKGFVLHVMGKFPEENKATLIDLKNRKMAEEDVLDQRKYYV